MRLPDRPGERGARDERDGTGQARGSDDALRQRLDRLAACHPSSPDYAETEHRGLAVSGEMGRGDQPDGANGAYGEMERGQLADSRDNGETKYEAGGAGAERAAGEKDRQAAKPVGRDGGLAGRDGELAGPDDGRADRPGAGRPAGWRAADAGSWPAGGAADGLGGGSEPYRPWFTAGESPEPWFTSDSGG